MSHPTLDGLVKREQELSRRIGEEVLRQFPDVQYAFCYGSAVNRQGSSPTGAAISIATPNTSLRDSKMMDFIFVTSDPQMWHRRNIRKFPHHYSSLRHLGANCIADIQESAAGAYFNPYAVVPITDRALAQDLGLGHLERPELLIKYGVVSSEVLTRDLLFWEHLYLSGRMHKPVTVLRSNPIIHTASQYNLHHALSVALLSLPERFSELDLFTAICSISYAGDIRMGLAEDPAKVRKIVLGALPLFRALYGPLLPMYLATEELPFYAPGSPQLSNYAFDNEKKFEKDAVEIDPATLLLRKNPDPTLTTRLLSSLPLALHREAAQETAPRPKERLPPFTPEFIGSLPFIRERTSLLPYIGKKEYQKTTALPFSFPTDYEESKRWDQELEVVLARNINAYEPFLQRFPIFHELFTAPIPQSPEPPLPAPSVAQIARDLEGRLPSGNLEDDTTAKELFAEKIEQIRHSEEAKSALRAVKGSRAKEIARKVVNRLFTARTNYIRQSKMASVLDIYKPYIPRIEQIRQYDPLGLEVLKKKSQWDEATKLQSADEVSENLRRGAAKIVQYSSQGQTWKGLWTAGLTRSTIYAISKLLKRR